MEVNHFITIYNISKAHKNKHKKAKKYQDILFVFLVSMSVKVYDLYYKVCACAGLSEFPCNQSLSVSVYRVMADRVLLDWYIRNAA